MTSHLAPIETKLSDSLRQVASTLPDPQVEIRVLLERIGEQGLLLTCMFLCLPFLFPVSIPGVSTAFGLLIVLIAISISLDRAPWFPRRLLDRKVQTSKLADVLKRGANLFARIERISRPRLLLLTRGGLGTRLNGLALLAGGLLLMVPLGLVPFSNTLPALAVLFLAGGMLQRDGFLIVLGHVANVATVAYFGGLAFAAWKTGEGVWSLIGKG